MIAVPGYSDAVQAYLQARSWEHGMNLSPTQAREFLQYTLEPAGTLEDGTLTLFRIRPVAGGPAAASVPGAVPAPAESGPASSGGRP